jgi:hypothetical protein
MVRVPIDMALMLLLMLRGREQSDLMAGAKSCQSVAQKRFS